MPPAQNRSKLGRRAFGKSLAAATLVTSESSAQTPADSGLRAARQELQQAGREIAKVSLARSVEPAFQFKA
jgi:hypothetical protein